MIAQRFFLFGGFGIILKVLVVASMIALYLYSKLSPHKDRLDAKHRGWYDTIDKFLGGISRSLGKSAKPYQVGDGIFLDMGQLYLFIILGVLALAMMMGL
jgi:hypothetical protein